MHSVDMFTVNGTESIDIGESFFAGSAAEHALVEIPLELSK